MSCANVTSLSSTQGQKLNKTLKTLKLWYPAEEKLPLYKAEYFPLYKAEYFPLYKAEYFPYFHLLLCGGDRRLQVPEVFLHQILSVPKTISGRKWVKAAYTQQAR